MRYSVLTLLYSLCLSGGVGADDLLVKAYYDGAPSRLDGTSFVPYVCFDSFSLGVVSRDYLERLRNRGVRAEVIAADVEGKNIWLCYGGATALPVSATVADVLPGGHFIVLTDASPPMSKPVDFSRLLTPIPADWRALEAQAKPVNWPTNRDADVISAIVAAVDPQRYRTTVSELAAFGTRYAYSSANKDAASYIEAALKGEGLSVHRDRFWGEDLHVVSAPSPAAAWAGSVGGMVARTTDGGSHWECLGDVCGAGVTAIAAISSSSCLVGSSAGSVFRTQDGGLSWTEVAAPGGQVASIFLDAAGENGWLVTTRGEVWRTGDGGASWSRAASLNDWLRDVAFASGSRGVICGNEGYLAVTSDGGTTWSRADARTRARIYAVAYRTPDEVYAAGEGGLLLRSRDGGETWTRVDLGTEEFLRDIDFNAGVGYLTAGYRGVYTTADGVNWRFVPTPPYVLYSVAAAAPDDVWCGTSGGALLHYRNGAWSDDAARADPSSPYVWENVWARRGTGYKDAVILSCHFDSINLKESSPTTPTAPAPGADDNATGSAAVLELARAFRGYDFDADVIFAAFNGEEKGLLGSHHFAGALAAEGAGIVGTVNMDMLGYGDASPEDIDVIFNDRSAWLAETGRRAAARYYPAARLVTRHEEFMVYSDHASFWIYGYPAFLAIEDWPVRYPYIHTSHDTPDKLDFDLAVNACRGIAAAAAAIARPAGTPDPGPLTDLEVYPNPYRPDKGDYVYFTPLPPRSRLRFYNVAGELVYETTSGDETVWPLAMTAAPKAWASGVYIYAIETPAGEKLTGKLAVIK